LRNITQYFVFLLSLLLNRAVGNIISHFATQDQMKFPRVCSYERLDR